MIEQYICGELRIFVPASSMVWVQKEFQVPSGQVFDLIAISLCPYHGVGQNGVHRNTYGRLIQSIQPTFWDEDRSSWYFTAQGKSGREVQGVLWYSLREDNTHLAVIEIVGSQPHVSAVVVDDHGKGSYLVGWEPNLYRVGIEIFLWNIIATMVFQEDIIHIQKYGYRFGEGNPFRNIVQVQ